MLTKQINSKLRLLWFIGLMQESIVHFNFLFIVNKFLLFTFDWILIYKFLFDILYLIDLLYFYLISSYNETEKISVGFSFLYTLSDDVFFFHIFYIFLLPLVVIDLLFTQNVEYILFCMMMIDLVDKIIFVLYFDYYYLRYYFCTKWLNEFVSIFLIKC